MRKYVALGMIAALALGAQTAAAEGFSYNLIEGDYAFADLEGIDGDGFGVKGSAEFAPNLHGAAGYQQLNFDGGLDIDTFSLGLNLNYALSDNADLIGGVSYENMKVSLSGFGSESESGYGLTAGVRGRVADNFELAANVKYSDISDLEAFTYSAGVRWYLTPNFALGADFNKLDFDAFDGEAWVVSLRYDFGDR